jgi:type IV secretory pathway VirB6-like protein
LGHIAEEVSRKPPSQQHLKPAKETNGFIMLWKNANTEVRSTKANQFILDFCAPFKSTAFQRVQRFQIFQGSSTAGWEEGSFQMAQRFQILLQGWSKTDWEEGCIFFVIIRSSSIIIVVIIIIVIIAIAIIIVIIIIIIIIIISPRINKQGIFLPQARKKRM